MTILSLRDVTLRFGGLVANDKVSFDVKDGELFAIIGPNGAGKSSLFNVIAGALPATSGKVIFDGSLITGLSQQKIASLGVIRTYQLVELIGDMTVAENIAVGFHRVTTGGIFSALLRPRSFHAQEHRIRMETIELLKFVELQDQANLLADKLPYGQRRLLELARALAAGPRLLLLDEPAAGLNVQETSMLAATIKRINARGITVLLIEHDMSLVMKIADQIAVLDFGRKIAEGTPDDIRRNADVLAAYLGGAEASLA